MLDAPLYQTSATATGGREGRVATADGTFHAWLDQPADLGGRGQGNNPEQLFASAYAACFLSAMRSLRSQGHPPVPAQAQVTASVGIGPRSGGGFCLSVALSVSLPDMDRIAAEALMTAAHAICPYSHAIRDNVAVTLTLA